MKILLINPPQIFFELSQDFNFNLPLGIMYLGSILKNNNYNVKILDTLAQDNLMRSKGNIRRYGMTWESINKAIEKESPEIIGISTPFTAQLNNTLILAKLIKKINSDILVIAGGPHISVLPRRFLESAPFVDIGVIGEGEYTILDLCKYYEGEMELSEIKGISYRENGKITLTKSRPFIDNLDQIPFPAYELVNMKKYLETDKYRYRGAGNLKAISMITSRGCPYNCVFCSIALHMGKKWRPHSPKYVINHINHVITKYGVQYIHFEDDNLTLNPIRFEKIIDEMLARKFDIQWDTPNGVRADRLNKRILIKMKKSGCKELTIGVESGDQYVLDKIINKSLKLKDVIKIAKICKELDIPLNAFYVIGFPGEKKENINRTMEFALTLEKKYNVNIRGPYFATPLYGTRLYEICKKNNYFSREITSLSLSEATQGLSLIKTEDFNPSYLQRINLKMKKMFFRIKILNFMKNPFKEIKYIYNREGSFKKIMILLPKLLKFFTSNRMVLKLN